MDQINSILFHSPLYFRLPVFLRKNVRRWARRITLIRTWTDRERYSLLLRTREEANTLEMEFLISVDALVLDNRFLWKTICPCIRGQDSHTLDHTLEAMRKHRAYLDTTIVRPAGPAGAIFAADRTGFIINALESIDPVSNDCSVMINELAVMIEPMILQENNSQNFIRRVSFSRIFRALANWIHSGQSYGKAFDLMWMIHEHSASFEVSSDSGLCVNYLKGHRIDGLKRTVLQKIAMFALKDYTAGFDPPLTYAQACIMAIGLCNDNDPGEYKKEIERALFQIGRNIEDCTTKWSSRITDPNWVCLKMLSQRLNTLFLSSPALVSDSLIVSLVNMFSYVPDEVKTTEEIQQQWNHLVRYASSDVPEGS